MLQKDDASLPTLTSEGLSSYEAETSKLSWEPNTEYRLSKNPYDYALIMVQSKDGFKIGSFTKNLLRDDMFTRKIAINVVSID